VKVLKRRFVGEWVCVVCFVEERCPPSSFVSLGDWVLGSLQIHAFCCPTEIPQRMSRKKRKRTDYYGGGRMMKRLTRMYFLPQLGWMMPKDLKALIDVLSK